ncbi:hypothetical protein GIB67_020060 [Kingdonia uniflora]|uniref:Uncharacterized protein n=1 Tax=Kingdonia uniflora TaxID=39325 RepID=A0A7J7L2G2_9MAGN|nr:hypothetical protein GIB67_020060 [Kingdonia uniflora]
MDAQSLHESNMMVTGGDGDSSSSPPTVGGKRGRSCGPTMLLNGEKKFVSVNYLGQPNKGDQNHHDLVTTLGVQTRTHIPIIYADIKAVSRDNIKNIMNHLEGSFNMSDVSREYLRDRIIAVWRNFKSYLHTKYVKGKNPTVVKAGVAPEFVNIDDWCTFVNYCNSATFQDNQNSANRKKLEASACVGRNNMAVIWHNIEKIRQCERLNPKTKISSVDDSIAKTIDKDRKGRMIALGTGVCPIILKKAKHLLKQNEDLRNTNLELTDEIKAERTYTILCGSSVEISMLVKVKTQVFEFKGMMMDIAEKVLCSVRFSGRGVCDVKSLVSIDVPISKIGVLFNFHELWVSGDKEEETAMAFLLILPAGK